jgi:hypothetical protein
MQLTIERIAHRSRQRQTKERCWDTWRLPRWRPATRSTIVSDVAYLESEHGDEDSSGIGRRPPTITARPTAENEQIATTATTWQAGTQSEEVRGSAP